MPIQSAATGPRQPGRDIPDPSRLDPTDERWSWGTDHELCLRKACLTSAETYAQPLSARMQWDISAQPCDVNVKDIRSLAREYNAEDGMSLKDIVENTSHEHMQYLRQWTDHLQTMCDETILRERGRAAVSTTDARRMFSLSPEQTCKITHDAEDETEQRPQDAVSSAEFVVADTPKTLVDYSQTEKHSAYSTFVATQPESVRGMVMDYLACGDRVHMDAYLAAREADMRTAYNVIVKQEEEQSRESILKQWRRFFARESQPMFLHVGDTVRLALTELDGETCKVAQARSTAAPPYFERNRRVAVDKEFVPTCNRLFPCGPHAKRLEKGDAISSRILRLHYTKQIFVVCAVHASSKKGDGDAGGVRMHAIHPTTTHQELMEHEHASRLRTALQIKYSIKRLHGSKREDDCPLVLADGDARRRYGRKSLLKISAADTSKERGYGDALSLKCAMGAAPRGMDALCADDRALRKLGWHGSWLSDAFPSLLDVLNEFTTGTTTNGANDLPRSPSPVDLKKDSQIAMKYVCDTLLKLTVHTLVPLYVCLFHEHTRVLRKSFRVKNTGSNLIVALHFLNGTWRRMDPSGLVSVEPREQFQ